MFKIYIIEDDEVISKEIAKFLISWNYKVIRAKDYTNIIYEFNEYEPDLVLIDITLPYFNGYHRTEEIRKSSNIPIIFISAQDENMNQIMAMNLGADDYITKPFSLEYLQAKINAILRRTYNYVHQLQLEVGGIILNSEDMSLNYDEKKIELSKNEYKILEMLVKNKGKIVTREELMNKLWQSDEFIDDNTLNVNIKRVRDRLNELGFNDLINTKKGVGYYVL